ncbi:MAG: PepSY-associated TM helix domain-containing protein [Vicinamibacterales bacterium]|jgi:uncharacterized iron-regulated membrane protein
MRRLLFHIHVVVGVATGLYVFVIGISGAALVFRIDMQRALHPHLFTARATGPLAEPVAVMASVSRAYPRHRLSGVEAPTTSRPTYLAYVTSGVEFRTVLVDPVSTDVLGELPDHTPIQALQELHFNLLGGRAGRLVNGAGAFAILILCATGLVIWWPGARAWRRGFMVDTSRDGPPSPRLWRPSRRVLWELHRAIGIWTVAFTVMFAVTGLSFVFPSGLRAVVDSVSTITVARSPQSGAPAAGNTPPSWAQMLDRARGFAAGQHVARVVMPFGDRGAFLVMFANESPTPAGSELTSIYLDQYTGDRLATTSSGRTMGDAAMAAMAPLHVGGVGGQTGKVIWFLFGLGPPILFVSGFILWWIRKVRPRLS